MPSPFNTSLRRDPSQPRDLGARIDAQIRERIEEAVDFVCLQRMVETRRARGLPAPAADDPRDRAEFDAGVRAFLEWLGADLTAGLPEEHRRRLADAAPREVDPWARLIAVQVALAKQLPDYWQRLDASRMRYAGASSRAGDDERRSGGKGGGLLGRLLGHG